MKPILFHPEASLELDDAWAYYETLRRGLGQELQDEVERAIAQLQQFPSIGAPYKDTSLRRIILQRFPYILYYRELPQALWIEAMAHASRRPMYWHRRGYPEE